MYLHFGICQNVLSSVRSWVYAVVLSFNMNTSLLCHGIEI